MSKAAPAIPDPAPDRPGIAFQNLVAMIERTIAGSDGVTLESPAFVLDADGDRREHDILITHTNGLRVTKTAVECKDRGRPIGKPDLEAFRTKCNDTGIHNGVIVSSSGFTQTAMKAARRMNLQCLELYKADSFPWVGTSVFVITRRIYSNIDVQVFAETAIVPPFQVFAENGVELTMEHYQNIAQRVLSQADEETQKLGRDGEICTRIRAVVSDVHAVDANGENHRVSFLDLTPTFFLVDEHQPFELHCYRGENGEIDIATSEIALPGVCGKLVMAKDGERIRLSIAPHPPK